MTTWRKLSQDKPAIWPALSPVASQNSLRLKDEHRKHSKGHRKSVDPKLATKVKAEADAGRGLDSLFPTLHGYDIEPCCCKGKHIRLPFTIAHGNLTPSLSLHGLDLSRLKQQAVWMFIPSTWLVST